MGLQPESRFEAEHVLEVSHVPPESVDVAHDEQLHEGDEEERPAGAIVVQEINEVASGLKKKKKTSSKLFQSPKY